LKSLAIILILFGVILGVLNWFLFFKRIIRKTGASAIPGVALVFVLIGSIFLGDEPNKIYLWAILFIDFTALAMVIFVTFKAIKSKIIIYKKT
jgi:drug/metabolite transporter (DMT)-like permease